MKDTKKNNEQFFKISRKNKKNYNIGKKIQEL